MYNHNASIIPKEFQFQPNSIDLMNIYLDARKSFLKNIKSENQIKRREGIDSKQ